MSVTQAASHFAAVTPADTRSRPLEPDTCMLPREPIGKIHASPPSVQRVRGVCSGEE